jgi:CHAD domain-containing protein
MMNKFAHHRVSLLLRRVAVESGRVSKAPTADAVHDLRVSLRRFTNGLRVLQQFFPKAAARKVRRQAKAVLALAGAVRDRDIALELLAAAGIPEGASVVTDMRRARTGAELALQTEVERWRRGGVARRWRERLEV